MVRGKTAVRKYCTKPNKLIEFLNFLPFSLNLVVLQQRGGHDNGRMVKKGGKEKRL